MLSNDQKALLKQAQRQAGLADAEYRECLVTVSGFDTSTARGFSDRHLDKALAYFEAICWRKVDAGALQPPSGPRSVFRQRGYWARKNTKEETSRDRYAQASVESRIASLEAAFHRAGYSAGYCFSIREKVTKGRTDVRSLNAYCAAMERTLAAMENHAKAGNKLPAMAGSAALVQGASSLEASHANSEDTNPF